MSNSVVSLEKTFTPDEVTLQVCTLHVCTSCRAPGTPRQPQESRAGFIFYQQLRSKIEGGILKHQVEIQPVECLSICPRPCGLALSRAGAWTYLFGDQWPNETVNDVLECVSLYRES